MLIDRYGKEVSYDEIDNRIPAKYTYAFRYKDYKKHKKISNWLFNVSPVKEHTSEFYSGYDICTDTMTGRLEIEETWNKKYKKHRKEMKRFYVRFKTLLKNI